MFTVPEIAKLPASPGPVWKLCRTPRTPTAAFPQVRGYGSSVTPTPVNAPVPHGPPPYLPPTGRAPLPPSPSSRHRFISHSLRSVPPWANSSPRRGRGSRTATGMGRRGAHGSGELGNRDQETFPSWKYRKPIQGTELHERKSKPPPPAPEGPGLRGARCRRPAPCLKPPRFHF